METANLYKLVACGLIAALSACAPESELGPDSSPRASEVEDEEDDVESTHFRANAIVTRGHYLGLRQYQYRQGVFGFLRQLGENDDETNFRQLAILVDLATTTGVDGLETLVIAHADALANTEYEEVAKELLSSKADEIVNYLETPPLNVLQPLGRSTTRMVLNTRSDAAQIMLAQLTTEPDSLDVDVLLNTDHVKEDICGLTPASGTLDASAALLAADTQLQDACAEMQGGGSTGANSLAGGMSADACLNIDLSGAKNTFAENEDGYGMDDQLADMEECVADVAGGGPTGINIGRVSGIHLVSNGFVKALPEILLLVESLGGDKKETEGLLTTLAKQGINSTGKLAEQAGAALIDHYKQQADYELKRDQAIDSLGTTIAGLDAQIKSASDRVADWDKAIKQIDQQLKGFGSNGFRTDKHGNLTNKAENGKTKAELDAEKAAAEAAKKKAEDDKKALEEKKAIAEAVKKELEKQKKKDDGLDVATSEACDRATLGGDPFGHEEVEASWESFQKRLEPMVNPNPEGPVPGDEPRDGLGLPSCGQDQTSREQSCSSVAMCTEGESCGCTGTSGTAIASEAEIMAQLSTSARCHDIICTDGVPQVRGTTCICVGEGGDESVEVPPIPPVTANLAEAFFVGAPEREAYQGDDPLNVFMDEAM